MNVCARDWWASLQMRARGVHQTQTSEGDVMRSEIKVVKRRGEDIKLDHAPAAPTKPHLTTEMIIKNWIIESRERRQTAMSQLQSSIRWEELGGPARG